MTDIYQDVTNRIVAALEADPGKFQLPWHKGRGFGFPTNAHTKNGYQGVNVITLWCVGHPYSTQTWATYRQWQELGCQVRKGEKGAHIIYYSTFEREDDQGDPKKVPFIKQSAVFNADQVDGYEAPLVPKLPPLERLQAIDAFVTATGANVTERGDRAFYAGNTDTITMPLGELFFDPNRTENYYSTLMHELTHWSGHPRRLARDMGGKFGNPVYAFEELVAELGAAFLCAKLSITPTVRDDHSQYIKNWLTALKGDKKFIFSAASQAQMAVDYLLQLHNDPGPH